jgi:ribosome-associated toxin RatA of RatAB toxin-antitoxin module
MAKVEKSVLVPYSAAQMYALVDAVESYSEFLPWCGGTSLIARTETLTEATIHINYHHVKQSFTTVNTKTFPSLMVISLKDGPFSHLSGAWQFKALSEQACKIEFTLNYEFANTLLEKIISPVFNHIANTFVDAFVERAEKVY